MFHNKKHYPQLAVLEDNFEVIRKEYEQIKKLRMYKWPEKEKYKGSWSTFGLYHNGRKLKTSSKQCPKTVELIESMGKVAMAGFSIMAPGTQIHAHVDKVPTFVYRVHLGIDIPKGECSFWVNGACKKWGDGEAFLFDPLLVHSAWNRTTENRVILLLDFESFNPPASRQ